MGAGQGMGRAIARHFTQAGATVVALDLNLAAAQETLQGLGGKSMARAPNVGDSAAVNAVVDEVVALLGGGGVVINISSTAAVSGDSPAHDVASKAAIMGLTCTMAKELAKSGIRVNTLVPSPSNTPMMAGIPQEWADAIVAGMPIGRMAEPDDIAKVALFLASDDSGFVTGQNVAVNGGSAFLWGASA